MAGLEVNVTRYFHVNEAFAMGIAKDDLDDLVAFRVEGPHDKIANSAFVKQALTVHAAYWQVGVQMKQLTHKNPFVDLGGAYALQEKIQLQMVAVFRITRLDVTCLQARAFGKDNPSEVTEADIKALNSKA